MLEVVIRAENRVDFEIVARIVMMIALRLEDRVQIDCVDAEILEIRQLRLDAAQIAAEEIMNILEKLFPQINTDRKKRKANVDQMAASTILQTYLDRKKGYGLDKGKKD